MNSWPTAYSPGAGSLKPSLSAFLGEELVRDLHQDAGAVAGARIGADRAAVLEIAEDGERVLDDLVRLAALDVGDEADAAGILVERRIVETLRRRQAGIGGVAERRMQSADNACARRACCRAAGSSRAAVSLSSHPRKSSVGRIHRRRRQTGSVRSAAPSALRPKAPPVWVA